MPKPSELPRSFAYHLCLLMSLLLDGVKSINVKSCLASVSSVIDNNKADICNGVFQLSELAM